MNDETRIIPFPTGRKSKRSCPHCGKPAVAEYGPFCSRRCQQVDLGHWLNGSYRIATDEAPSDGETGRDDET